MASTIWFGGNNKEDIFGKINGLITDMITKMEAEAKADATKRRKFIWSQMGPSFQRAWWASRKL